MGCRTSTSAPLLSYAFLFFLVFGLALADCFNPDGTPAGALFECATDDVHTGLCCRRGDLCLTNGVCLNPPEDGNGQRSTYYRGGCNNSKWSEGAHCPMFCTAKSELPGGVNVIKNCLDSDDYFYCQLNDDKLRGLKHCFGNKPGDVATGIYQIPRETHYSRSPHPSATDVT